MKEQSEPPRSDEADWASRSPHPFVELGPTGTILRTNAAARALASSDGIRGILPEGLEGLASTCLESGDTLGGFEVAVGSRTFSWTFQPAPSRASIGAFGYEVTSWERSEALLRRKDDLLEAVGSAARILLEADGEEIPLDAVLERLGRATGVSRIYVFRNHTSPDGDLLASQIAEWTQPHIEAQIDNPELQAMSYEDSGMGRWARELGQGATVGGIVDDFPPGEQEFLRAQDILSLVVTPIFLGQRFWGFIGFDDCDVRRSWSRAELEILQAAADTVAAALLRREALGALEDSRHQLRHVQRMEAVGRLAGGIAHDFNNLLTGILSNAELLLEDLDPSSPARSEAESIRKSALRASRLTRQLLAFSRRQAMRPTTVALPEVVRETEELARRLLGENIRVEARVDDDVPPVWADQVQVEQVLMNLVVNAGDAMPDGGEITLHVRKGDGGAADSARRGLDRDAGYVLVTVSDTGSGMDPAIQEKVFEPFFTTKATGTGMGLSIVYGIAKQIGGTVWIDSEPGEGTEVTVAFPVDPDPSEGTESAGEAPPGEQDVPSGDESILVVEDDEAVRNVTTRILRRAGYTVIDTESAEAALTILRRGDAAIDLVLTDIGLPDRSGTELAGEIRREHERLPVVFMSGFPGHRGSGTPPLPDDTPPDFLAKPFTRSALLRRVRRHLDDEGSPTA